LYDLSGTAERTQREYDKVAKVKRQRNLAIGERYTKLNAEERAWKQGRGVFHFVDSHGLQGHKNGEYLAWQLPNSYCGPHDQRSRGSRKRINRKLADLVNKGIPGNDGQPIEQVFWPDGASAAREYSRDPERDAYWLRGQSQRRNCILWHVFPNLRR